MKIKLFTLITLTSIFLMACGSKNPLQEIEDLEKSIQEAPSKEDMQLLVSKYLKYVDEHQEDNEKSPDFLQKAASLKYKLDEISTSAEILRQSVKSYFASSNTDANIIALTNMHMLHLNNDDNRDSLNRLFKNSFPSEAEMDKKLTALIQQQSKISTDSATQKINQEAALNYMNLSEMYGMLLPAAPLAPENLLEAAKMAEYFKQYERALSLYAFVAQQYKDPNTRGNAMFMRAFTMDDKLSRLDDAKLAYIEFIEEYPEHPLNKDAQFLLNNLGRTEEEIIQSFGK